jgi:hypothetical protein
MTAVEWFYDQIENQGKCIYEVIEQAKEMEKEQIVESFSLGIISHHDAFKNQNKWNNGEQYYNETFKSE